MEIKTALVNDVKLNIDSNNIQFKKFPSESVPPISMHLSMKYESRWVELSETDGYMLYNIPVKHLAHFILPEEQKHSYSHSYYAVELENNSLWLITKKNSHSYKIRCPYWEPLENYLIQSIHTLSKYNKEKIKVDYPVEKYFLEALTTWRVENTGV